MSFASGFFNSVDHDRLYDATDISRLFDGLIRDGIFASIGDCLVVKQSNQMNVTVGTGRAWFNHTWSYNDALYPVTIPPSEILMDRIDAVVLEINSVESVRANSIKLIKGTPSSTPAKPALTNTKEVHQYPLAYVTVGKEVTSIRQADIENCVGTSSCPFVTGILEVISIEQLIPQWKDILNRFVEENTANFNTWMNGEKQDYQAWLTAAKKRLRIGKQLQNRTIRNGMTVLRMATTSGLLQLKLLMTLTGQHSNSGKRHLRPSLISGLKI